MKFFALLCAVSASLAVADPEKKEVKSEKELKTKDEVKAFCEKALEKTHKDIGVSEGEKVAAGGMAKCQGTPIAKDGDNAGGDAAGAFEDGKGDMSEDKECEGWSKSGDDGWYYAPAKIDKGKTGTIWFCPKGKLCVKGDGKKCEKNFGKGEVKSYAKGDFTCEKGSFKTKEKLPSDTVDIKVPKEWFDGKYKDAEDKEQEYGDASYDWKGGKEVDILGLKKCKGKGGDDDDTCCIIIVVCCVVGGVLLIGGIVVFFMMSGGDADEEEDDEEAEEEDGEEE